MTTLLRLLVGLSFTACAAFAGAELSSVPFVTGKQQFKAGDSIVIDHVFATSPQLAIGTKVTVRGRYQLASAPKASLGLHLTHRAPADAANASAKSQVQQVEHASGAFELSCEITYQGDPHISFYPAGGGASFGGVYFSIPRPKS
jgi:hypothetical protein